MYWFAEKPNGEIIELTEREALTHFERNNISDRMRLRFIGTSSGEHQKAAREKIGKLISEAHPADFSQLTREEQNVVNQTIRSQKHDEIRDLLKEARAKELEEAKTNGVKKPRTDLRYHTPKGSDSKFSREQIIGNIPR